MYSPEMDDDNASVISFGTMDKAINSTTKQKDLVEDVEDVIRPYKKRSREDFIDGFIPDNNPRVKRPDKEGSGLTEQLLKQLVPELLKQVVPKLLNQAASEPLKQVVPEHLNQVVPGHLNQVMTGPPFVNQLVSARGLEDEEDMEVANTEDDMEGVNAEDAEIEKELDENDIEKVLPEFIEVMIASPKKRIWELFRSLKKKGANDDEYVVKLEELIDDFLRGKKKKVTKEIEDALRALKTSCTTVEINNILNEIEDMNRRFTDILKRLDDTDDQLAVVQNLKQEQTISQSAYAKLSDKLESDDLSLPVIVEILEEHPNRKNEKIGQGVIYLPTSIEGLRKKFCLLTGEYKAGNKTTRNEIVAILDELRGRNLITEKQYIGCNDWLNEEDDDFALKICDKLSELSTKYDAGDRSVGPEILKCTEELVRDGCVTDEDWQEVRDKIHGH